MIFPFDWMEVVVESDNYLPRMDDLSCPAPSSPVSPARLEVFYCATHTVGRSQVWMDPSNLQRNDVRGGAQRCCWCLAT